MAEPRRARSPTTRPGSRRCATRSARADGSASTPTAPGTSTTRSRRSTAAGPGGRRPGVRRAAVRRGRGPGARCAGGVDVPIAADESIRRAADPYRVRDLEAADIAVLKVQPLGGVRACLRIAEDIGLPVVVSSALGDVGRASPPGSRWPRRCRSCQYACGLATVQLLTDDVADEPLLPVDGVSARAAPRSSDERARPAARRRPDRVAHWRARLAEVRAVRPGSALVTLRPSWPAASSRRWSRPASREVVVAPGSRNAPLSFAAYDAAEAGLVRLHTRHRRALRRLPRPRPDQGRQPGPPWSARRAPPSPTCTRPCSRPRTPACRLVVVTADRPARLRGTGANQTTDQVGIFGPLVPSVDLGPGEASVARTALGPARVRCTSTSSSTTRWCPTTRWDCRSVS